MAREVAGGIEMKPNVYSVTVAFNKEPPQTEFPYEMRDGVEVLPWYRVCPECEPKLYGRNNEHLQR